MDFECAIAIVLGKSGKNIARESAISHVFGFTIYNDISRNETLHAGEVIGSGTVGSGCGLELGRFSPPGALVELEVTGRGVLRNGLVQR